MAIIMSKGCPEAIYGLMGWKGLMRISQDSMVYSLPKAVLRLCECPAVFTEVENFLRLYVHDIGCVSL